MHRLRHAVVPAAAALALAAAGCGGEEESATEQWAGGVCSAITTLDQSVSAEVEGLRNADAPVEAIGEATAGIEAALGAFVDELGGLGPPDTEAGRRADEILKELSADLSSQRDTVRRVLDDTSATALEKISLVSGALSTIAAQLQAAWSELATLDPGGELEDAFQQSDECTELREAGSDG